MFFWDSLALYDPTNVGNLISGSSAFSKPSLYIWKFFIQVLLKPSLKYFEHNLASMWNERNCPVIWTFFGTAFLWDWNENWPFLREGDGTPLWYSCLENPMDGGAVHGVSKSRTRLSNFTFTHWRRKWQPTEVFLPGESQSQGSLVGCRLQGCTESDTTKAT